MSIIKNFIIIIFVTTFISQADAEESDEIIKEINEVQTIYPNPCP